MTGVQAELARGRLAKLASLTAEADTLEARITELVGNHPMLSLPSAGVLGVAKVVAEVGDVSRLRSADGFALLAGVAPVPASSGQTSRMRLNRSGNRQLNRAIHTIAIAQL